MSSHLLRTKSIELLRAEASATGEHSLKRVLGPINPVSYTHLTLPTNREV